MKHSVLPPPPDLATPKTKKTARPTKSRARARAGPRAGPRQRAESDPRGRGAQHAALGVEALERHPLDLAELEAVARDLARRGGAVVAAARGAGDVGVWWRSQSQEDVPGPFSAALPKYERNQI